MVRVSTVDVDVVLLDWDGESFDEVREDLPITLWSHVSNLSSKDVTWFDHESNHFILHGNGRFEKNATDEKKIKPIVCWLKSHGCDGLQLDYVEMQEEDDVLVAGRVHVLLDAAQPDGYTLKIQTYTWDVADYFEAHHFGQFPSDAGLDEWRTAWEDAYNDLYCKYWGSSDFEALDLKERTITGTI